VIEPASVIGLNFMRPALNELVVDAVRPEVNSHLTTLTQKQLIRPDRPTSADDFRFLLDELNAYSHDLNSSVRLVSLRRPEHGEVGHRDGLAALMSFVLSYADTARQSVPATWESLQRPETKETVRTLWTQAEKALASSCGIPAFGRDDKKSIGFLCDPRNHAGLTDLLGRAPACPATCLGSGTASAGTSVTR